MNEALKEPVTADFIELTPEIKQIHEAWKVIAPQLDKLNHLAHTGWLTVFQGETLIDAAIRELTLLRAEHAPAPVAPNINELCVGAFSTMCGYLREHMHNTEASVHQHRFNAFVTAVHALLPAIRNTTNFESIAVLQGLMKAQIDHCTGLIAVVSASGDDTGKRQAQIGALEAERAAYDTCLAFMDSLIKGGQLPEAAAKVAQDARVRKHGLLAGTPVH